MPQRELTPQEVKHNTIVNIVCTLTVCATAVALLAIITNNP